MKTTFTKEELISSIDPTARATLQRRDSDAKAQLEVIGAAVGYGNAQDLLGQLWNEMLARKYAGLGATKRGAMGVTIKSDLPPIPKPEKYRRQQQANGCYALVEAYSVEELERYAAHAISANVELWQKLMQHHLSPDTETVRSAAETGQHAAQANDPARDLIEDEIEASYWRFDALKKGNTPLSERDAFKAQARLLVAFARSLK